LKNLFGRSDALRAIYLEGRAWGRLLGWARANFGIERTKGPDRVRRLLWRKRPFRPKPGRVRLKARFFKGERKERGSPGWVLGGGFGLWARFLAFFLGGALGSFFPRGLPPGAPGPPVKGFWKGFLPPRGFQTGSPKGVLGVWRFRNFPVWALGRPGGLDYCAPWVSNNQAGWNRFRCFNRGKRGRGWPLARGSGKRERKGEPKENGTPQEVALQGPRAGANFVVDRY